MDVAPAVCQVSGDPHYVSFDGAKFDYMGPGYYWVVKSETVQVQALNVACAGALRRGEATHEAPIGCTYAVAARVKRPNGWVEKNTADDGSFEIVEGTNQLRIKVEHAGVADSITVSCTSNPSAVACEFQ